nr:MAG TPA: hypothetical protein [Caudoviricetes sp.]
MAWLSHSYDFCPRLILHILAPFSKFTTLSSNAKALYYEG